MVENNMGRVLVTGGAGFIGSHVVEKLLSEGSSVLVIDNLGTGRESNISHLRSNPDFHFSECEVQSPKAASELLSFEPQVVIHLAAQMNVRRSVEDPVFDAQQNILGTINLLEASMRAKVEKFVFSSTGGAIYGEQECFPADEEHKTTPECPYGISKRAAELYIEHYAKKGTCKSYSLRFGNVYGPRQNPHGEAGVVSIFIDQILSQKPLTVNGDGSQTRDFIFVADIVDAICKVIDDSSTVGSGSLYEVFNLGTGIESSVKDIVETLGAVVKNKYDNFTLEAIYRPQPAGEQMRSLLDAGKFRDRFGWKPRISLEQGMYMTFESTLELPQGQQ
jgi:UDP-glucose 4-epimerase